MPNPYGEESQAPLKIPESNFLRVSIKQRGEELSGVGGAIWVGLGGGVLS